MKEHKRVQEAHTDYIRVQVKGVQQTLTEQEQVPVQNRTANMISDENVPSLRVLCFLIHNGEEQEPLLPVSAVRDYYNRVTKPLREAVC